MFIRTLFACAAVFALAGCSDDHAEPGGHHDGEEGAPSGATCPPGSTLTYETFAKDFFDGYCTRCHSSDKTDDARQGAPLGHDFDTEEGVLAVAEHVDAYAAAGPDSVNTRMPPSNPRPSEAERRQLGEWLACAADQ